jgi:hypothetical protein
VAGDGRIRRHRIATAVGGAVAEQSTGDERSRSGELPPSWPTRRGAREPLRLPTRWPATEHTRHLRRRRKSEQGVGGATAKLAGETGSRAAA